MHKKKKGLTACTHQNVKKQNARHTGIDIFQFTMNRSVKTFFFFCVLYWPLISTLTTWHTSWLHLGSLLTEKSQQKLCVQYSFCNTLYSGVLSACAQHITIMYKSCTWHTGRLDVLSSEDSFKKRTLNPVLRCDVVTQIRLICRKERSSRCFH